MPTSSREDFVNGLLGRTKWIADQPNQILKPPSQLWLGGLFRIGGVE